MKNSYIATSVGATLILAANAHGQWYVGADGGIAFQQNISIRDDTSPNDNGGGDVKFDTGWRVGGDVGYSFCKYFSTELDASDIHNSINTIGNQTLSEVGANAHLDEIPLLVNGIFTWPLGKFKPYVGVGVGAAIGIFDSYNVPGWAVVRRGIYSNHYYGDTDDTFAWQGEVGLQYEVIRHLDLGVVYKFVETSDNEWNDDAIPFKTDGTVTHTIMGTITWQF